MIEADAKNETKKYTTEEKAKTTTFSERAMGYLGQRCFYFTSNEK